MTRRWPWSKRNPSLTEQTVRWITETQGVLDKWDPIEAAKFRDLTRAFLREHEHMNPTGDELSWFVKRGVSMLERSAKRLDVDLPVAS